MAAENDCECGCGRKASAGRRFVHGHNRRGAKNKRDETPWLVEGRGYHTPCWTWQLSVNRGGYGMVNRDGYAGHAHRWVYMRHVGEIPDGLQLDHLCRNRDCVNPAHLEPVTQRENVLRGVAPTAANAQKTSCKRSHPFDDENTYFFPDGRRACRTCQRAARLAYQERKAAA